MLGCRDHRRVRTEHQAHDLGRHRILVHGRQTFRPDLADLAAEPQDRDSIAKREGFLELMGDEDDRQAALRQAAHQRAELFDALRRQHGGGFVEDEDAAAAQ